ncbi:hypothetical protein CPS_2227 [Colwellia psychrerythraea 34H]|uniref:Uncharacterized protein n=1 Tax=Colwellia psychrerythraea (strain 34H / ATCC BAA-681) TaxID=167879 RepID=Q482R5_COLP3|nr:hypothetical protein CPS_2227 [Colwellia psychrerythraea 34H]
MSQKYLAFVNRLGQSNEYKANRTFAVDGDIG